MGLQQHERDKAQNLTHDEAYKRIKDYYSDFIKKWNKMKDTEKTEHVFGNGRKSSVEYVNESNKYLTTLPNTPLITDSIDLAKNVISKRLEYSYHDEDKYGIKMGAYAHYIVENFNQEPQ